MDLSIGFFVDSLLADPFFYINGAFATVAALGVVLFFSGFFPGIVPALKESANMEHLGHQRVRAVWGCYLMLAAFILWRISLWLESLFI